MVPVLLLFLLPVGGGIPAGVLVILGAMILLPMAVRALRAPRQRPG